MNKPPRSGSWQQRVARAFALSSPLHPELLQQKAANYGPVLTWMAIRDCIKHSKPLPDWINAYLVGCTDRMLSDRAKLTEDARNELPWIFGFSGYKGALDPLRDLNREEWKGIFARCFARWIYRGKEPDEAFDRAKDDIYNEHLVKLVHPRRKRKQKRKAAGDEDNGFSDKERDLMEEFRLKRLPLTREEWLPKISRYFKRLHTQ
jgi:hypothetical protein